MTLILVSNLLTNHRFCGTINTANAGMAKLVDARDLKSREDNTSYRFDPGFRHHPDAEMLRGFCFFQSWMISPKTGTPVLVLGLFSLMIAERMSACSRRHISRSSRPVSYRCENRICLSEKCSIKSAKRAPMSV